MSTLHDLRDKITALADEYERLALVQRGTDYGMLHGDLGRRLRAVLAETAAAREPAWCSFPGCENANAWHDHARESVAHGDARDEFAWHEANGPVIDDDRYMPVTIARRLTAAQPVEPEADEREALAQVLYGHRQATGDFPDGHTEWADLPESWRDEWCEAADAVIAAGFRRSRPEATRTEWTVRHPDGRPISGAQVLPDRTWIDDFALARWPGAIVVRREVSAWTTVADTPTQAGDDT